LLDGVSRIALLVGCAEGLTKAWLAVLRLTVSGWLILGVRQAGYSSPQESDGDYLQVRLLHDRSSPAEGDTTRLEICRLFTLIQINPGLVKFGPLP
jgi:hypothetical protein